ncbi:MAG: hypothetical protein A3G34_10275 [Candidatus Lindowbacteria bacterium RIFCSPLOWO2_12_FULL_62_27]|nr:MAG: hypothetical protein A3G34_10275 [Candidatus Lindowbacteria bacterium RIFCSPLOWO2_12_FULL_62_27]OGH61623.1 MAG: hypothetical protein A3I06_03285 [Candidatus Lindowbacteria bacterium RIFCSPLOWO2_02_FULL_62_12]
MNNAIRGESGIGSWLTPVVRRLLWVNAILYLLKFLTTRWVPWNLLALAPAQALEGGMVWQFFTYMYLHFDVMHVLFNLFGLFMFGPDVEQVMGSRKFFTYYTLCGFGAALLACIAYPNGIILGSSGALYGVLVAFAVLFPYRPVYLWFFPVPVQARWFIVIFGLIDLIYSIEGAGNVAHVAHLGGLATGLVFFWVTRKLAFNQRRESARPNAVVRWVSSVRQKYERRKSEKLRLSAAELDTLLDKIARSGMNSLTRTERERLKAASADLRKSRE